MANSTPSADLKKRSVVSSFICYGEEGTDTFRVSIFKRSDQVRSYKNKWAACSGSIDPSDVDPLAAARREIEEETELTANDIRLLRAGKPYSIVDEELKTEWTIYPFAFVLLKEGKGKDGLVIDWEHTEYAFVKPEEVEKRDTVPHLSMSLERVLVGGVVAEGLRELNDDHESGASVLAGKALRLLVAAVKEGNVRRMRSVTKIEGGSKDSLQDWWRGLRMMGWHLIGARPSMGAAISSAVCKALKNAEDAIRTGANAEEIEERVVRRLDEALEARQQSSKRVAEQFCAWVKRQQDERKPLTILTLSSSSTIKACVLAAITDDTKIRFRLKVMESRPRFEGAAFVKSLLTALEERGIQDRLDVEIASDASAAILAQHCDIVLLGADRISEAGDVSNKTGSLTAVLCAKEVSGDVKVVVVSDTEKIAGPGDKKHHKEEDNEPAEILKDWPTEGRLEALSDLWKNRVKVRNVYFEWVPAHHISSYVTECGVLDVDAVKEQSARVAKMEDDLFGQL